jgi:hypothetical protein
MPNEAASARRYDPVKERLELVRLLGEQLRVEVDDVAQARSPARRICAALALSVPGDAARTSVLTVVPVVARGQNPARVRQHCRRCVRRRRGWSAAFAACRQDVAHPQ